MQFPIKHKFFSISEAGWAEANNNNKMIPAWDRMRNTLSPRSGWSTPDARIHALFVSESTWEAGLQVRLMSLIYLLLPEPPRMYDDLFWYFCYYFGAETFFSATQILLFCIFSSIYTIYSLQFFFFLNKAGEPNVSLTPRGIVWVTASGAL